MKKLKNIIYSWYSIVIPRVVPAPDGDEELLVGVLLLEGHKLLVPLQVNVSPGVEYLMYNVDI